jgi:ribonucleoside-diphosphate reductase beta chain
MQQPASKRTERADFQQTGDPAIASSNANLLSYEQLYGLWERQQWRTQDIDFTQDRFDWHERIDERERFQRLYGLSSFFVGEQRVASELGPLMRAAPTEPIRLFLCTQIADEARHVAFFDRFYEEVGVLSSQDLAGRLEQTHENLNAHFYELFDELLQSRIDRVAQDPTDQVALVEAITIYHMVIEGMLALTGQHFITSYNEEQDTLPGFVYGFNMIARDEHRHVAFGTRFLREMALIDPEYRLAIQRSLAQAVPAADGVLEPPNYDASQALFTVEETREFASTALTRRLRAIGLEES